MISNEVGDNMLEEDRCTVDESRGILPFNGPYLPVNSQSDRKCLGKSICDVGNKVKCWAPFHCSDEGCEANYEWANCNNQDCVKLVYPRIELEYVTHNSQTLRTAGIAVVSIGSIVMFITCIRIFMF